MPERKAERRRVYRRTKTTEQKGTQYGIQVLRRANPEQ